MGRKADAHSAQEGHCSTETPLVRRFIDQAVTGTSAPIYGHFLQLPVYIVHSAEISRDATSAECTPFKTVTLTASNIPGTYNQKQEHITCTVHVPVT